MLFVCYVLSYSHANYVITNHFNTIAFIVVLVFEFLSRKVLLKRRLLHKYTVMQIEKVLTNDHLRVAKVSLKFRIQTI